MQLKWPKRKLNTLHKIRMANNNNIEPSINELPSHFADRLGVQYSLLVSQQHKKKNGQYFTPIEIASFMSSLSKYNEDSVRILDPGCGPGILSCSLIEYLIYSNEKLKSVDLVVYETDEELIPVLKKTIDYLAKWTITKGLDIKTQIYSEDFVLHNPDSLTENDDLFSTSIVPFDIVISNPPYFKLPIDDLRAVAAKAIVNGHPNIYAIFMALSARLLKENGELIFITPRSYASGVYFKIFREYFFDLIDLDRVHLFSSRKETFSRDKVLQETVIIKGYKRANIESNSNVTISSSGGVKDINNSFIKSFPKSDIIDLQSSGKILYLPTSDHEEDVLDIFRNWSGTLAKYDIKISTGPVVAFRSLDYIRDEFENGKAQTTPLIWLHNVKQMELEWPIKKPGKGQYIIVANESKPILISNKNYVLLRRFSSKDDKSRLIAAPYFCNFIKSDFIGVENKVNYIFRPDGHLDRNEVVGLCALLNSKLFDAYFRIFNGNVNVSATELREMPLPDLETIKEIGNSVILSNIFSVENTNWIVNKNLIPEYIK